MKCEIKSNLFITTIFPLKHLLLGWISHLMGHFNKLARLLVLLDNSLMNRVLRLILLIILSDGWNQRSFTSLAINLINGTLKFNVQRESPYKVADMPLGYDRD